MELKYEAVIITGVDINSFTIILACSYQNMKHILQLLSLGTGCVLCFFIGAGENGVEILLLLLLLLFVLKLFLFDCKSSVSKG